MYTVYSLISQKDGRIYVGITSDFERRIKEHNAGKTRSTKGFRPWQLLCLQSVESRIAARELEKKWKSGAGKEYLKLIKLERL
ncbi:MAG: GIY-YIG nuclease family protein [Candidatus Omnitrophota bacterium]|nr:GIY-YIG nuclease family protein [Candidatus Omnitrophota bacterium]